MQSGGLWKLSKPFFQLHRTPIIRHQPRLPQADPPRDRWALLLRCPPLHSLLVLPTPTPIQALAVSRGRPGQGCRQHLHPLPWLPCPPEQAHAEVSWPRVLGWEGQLLALSHFFVLPAPRDALDLSDIDSEPPRGTFPALEPRNLLSLFEDSLGPS